MVQIFTNADKNHAAIVLSKLGLEDCFEGVICFETLNPKNNSRLDTRIVCKPSMVAMEAAFEIANIDPKKTVSGIFIHDSLRLQIFDDMFEIICLFSDLL